MSLIMSIISDWLSLLNRDIVNALLIFNEVLNKGFDAHHFVSGLSKHLRDLLVSKDPQTIKLMEVGADIGKRYQQQAQQCSADFLFNALKSIMIVTSTIASAVTNACWLSWL